jgi:hypothetical protein
MKNNEKRIKISFDRVLTDYANRAWREGLFLGLLLGTGIALITLTIVIVK